MNIVCKRCGKCCYIPFLQDGKLHFIKCRQLIVFGKADKILTSCRIYHHRLGFNIKKGYKCGLRKDSVYDFEGCPFNTNKEQII